MSTSALPRCFTLFALWLCIAIVGGYIAAFLNAGHGSVAIVYFAFPVGVIGAVASCVVLISSRVRGLRTFVRVVLVAIAASSPIVLIALYGVLTQPEYRLAEALMFVTPFAVAALTVAALAEWLVIQRAIASL